MPNTKTPGATSYHHGNLREALIDAAVQLVEEGGPENVSVREVAKRAGVSPGAPFRHFSSKTALMTAVAEQAMSRFRAEITEAVDNVAARTTRSPDLRRSESLTCAGPFRTPPISRSSRTGA